MITLLRALKMECKYICRMDSWCGPPFLRTLNLSVLDLAFLSKKACDFIVNKRWELPLNIRFGFPNLLSTVSTCHILAGDLEDMWVWSHIYYDFLILKEAYNFISNHDLWSLGTSMWGNLELFLLNPYFFGDEYKQAS